MDTNSIYPLANLFKNIQVELRVASFRHCPQDWIRYDIIKDFNKFYMVQSGEGWLKIKSNTYHPKSAQLYLIPAGVSHSYSVIDPNNTYLLYWCHFTATSNGEDLLGNLDLPDYIDLTPRDLITIKNYYNTLIESAWRDDIISILKTKTALLGIIAFYLEKSSLNGTFFRNNPNMEKLKTVMLYIDGNINNDITIQQLADLLHFNPKYFIKYFNKHTGMTPIQYINNKRIELSKHLLCTTDMQIDEIYFNVGFSSSHYFSRVFKNIVGISPTEFRNHQRKP